MRSGDIARGGFGADIVTLVILWLVGSTPVEHRTPGLLETECRVIAAGVVAPKHAKCELDTRTPRCPGYSCPPMREQPVICGYGGGCYQGGWKLNSAMPGDFDDR